MTEFFEMSAIGIEAAGIVLLLLGLTIATGRFVYRLLRGPGALPAYNAFRQEVGRILLLTLEILIGARHRLHHRCRANL